MASKHQFPKTAKCISTFTSYHQTVITVIAYNPERILTVDIPIGFSLSVDATPGKPSGLIYFRIIFRLSQNNLSKGSEGG